MERESIKLDKRDDAFRLLGNHIGLGEKPESPLWDSIDFIPLDAKAAARNAVWELVSNAMLHGSLGVSKEDELNPETTYKGFWREYDNQPAENKVEVSYEIDQENETVTFEVKDRGKGFDPSSEPRHWASTGIGAINTVFRRNLRRSGFDIDLSFESREDGIGIKAKFRIFKIN